MSICKGIPGDAFGISYHKEARFFLKFYWVGYGSPKVKNVNKNIKGS
jgi:hypothetical protein